MLVRDLNNVVDKTMPIWVNYGEYFAEKFDTYAEMREKTHVMGDDEVKYITVGADGVLTIEV